MRESERTFLDLSELFTRAGEMGALMRSTDWTQTPLGPVDQWSTSLKPALSLFLNAYGYELVPPFLRRFPQETRRRSMIRNPGPVGA